MPRADTGGLPPGPALPFWLQTLRIIAQPLQFLNTCQDRYGDRFTLRILGPQSPPVVFLSDLADVQAVFTTLADRLALGQVAEVFRPLVGSESLILQQGDRHRMQRQRLIPALHGPQLLSYGEWIRSIAQEAIAPWKPGDVPNLGVTLRAISLDVILRVVFGLEAGKLGSGGLEAGGLEAGGLEAGTRLGALRGELLTLLEAITDSWYSVQFFLPLLQRDLGPWSPWGNFVRRRSRIDALILDEIRARRAALAQRPPTPDSHLRCDVLSLLLEDSAAISTELTHPQGSPQGSAATRSQPTAAPGPCPSSQADLEIRDQLMTLLLLGHETTASTLAWVLYWLHHTPGCETRLRQELASLPPDIDTWTLAQQPYLSAICQEALRIQPIALIAQPRVVQEDLSLGGYTYDPGTVLVPCIQTSHRRPQTYPSPQTFEPERFLGRGGQSFSPYEYFPFGGGSRSCIGMALSLLELKVVLAEILRQHRLTPLPRGSVYPLRRGITFVPSANFQLRVEA